MGRMRGLSEAGGIWEKPSVALLTAQHPNHPPHVTHSPQTQDVCWSTEYF